MDVRTKNLASFLEKRCDKEIKDIEDILTELQSTIQSQFEIPESTQMTLWEDFGEEEFNRNKESLKLRLEQIPLELENERELIRRHYAEPKPRLFPIAVMLLVPDSF